MPWIKSGINKFIPSAITQSVPQIPKTLKLLAKNAAIIDVGAGGRRISPDVICADCIKMANTDIIADIHYFPFRENVIDCVFCTGVLEHIKTPLMLHNIPHDFSNLCVGNDCYIGKGVFLDLKSMVIIEDNVTISMQSTIITHFDAGRSPLSACGFPPSPVPVILRKRRLFRSKCNYPARCHNQ